MSNELSPEALKAASRWLGATVHEGNLRLLATQIDNAFFPVRTKVAELEAENAEARDTQAATDDMLNRALANMKRMKEECEAAEAKVRELPAQIWREVAAEAARMDAEDDATALAFSEYATSKANWLDAARSAPDTAEGGE